ncbi:Protein of unknown function [Bacillus cereus]|nr:Protein of unknown function [Bacillus cereus]
MTEKFKVGKRVYCFRGVYKGCFGKVTHVGRRHVEFACEKTGMDMEDCHPSCLIVEGEKVKVHTIGYSEKGLERKVYLDKYGAYFKQWGHKHDMEYSAQGHFYQVASNSEVFKYRNKGAK